MTDLTPYTPPAAPSTAAVDRLVAWAQGADAAGQLANALCRSAFVPEQFRGKPTDAAAAILAGGELGLSPMAALSAFDVIQGRATPRAITLRAVVQSLGHEIEVIESTDRVCRMRGRRRGSQSWQPVEWTTDRAQRLGLTGKPNWKAQPQNMLIARATAELCRLIAADALLGVAYTSEEAMDSDAPPVSPAHVPVTAAEILGTAAPEPQPEPEQAAEPGITSAQSKRIHATLHDLAVGGKEHRATGLAVLAHIIGHPIDTSSALTRAEAARVIDELDAHGRDLVADVLRGDWTVEDPPADADALPLEGD